ncbi:MAG TPA: hypothetical protein VGE07_28665, partial [Herpetosiphonaceae bacterium]
MTAFRTTTLGYPRVTPDRRYKTALEAFWGGKIDESALRERLGRLERELLAAQAAAGIDLVACGDFSWYDHVLDMAATLGCVPERFGWDGGPVGPALYFAMARGLDGVAPLEMTKWFDTNYHYLVPELPARFALADDRPLRAYEAARAAL